MMKAERIRLDFLLNKDSGFQTLESIAAKIKNGAVFVYPTETIYGLGGIAIESVETKIFAAKKRPPQNPMILIAGSTEDFTDYQLEMPKNAELLAKKFWPGNITLVVMSKKLNKNIGVRVSYHPFLSLISPLLRQPVFSTSANYSGEPYNPNPDTVFSLFSGTVDFMIDAGSLLVSKPSTVVSFDNTGAVLIIREGAVSALDIQNTVG